MKRLCIFFMLLAIALSGAAQRQQKWKTPKQPKRPKWVAPKQKSPEVIDVWRPYNFADNWFLEFRGGIGMSMAENMSGHGWDICLPKFEMGVGKQFSNLWSTRMTFGLSQQNGWASDKSLAASKLLGDGEYKFLVASMYVDEMLSLTRMFLPYSEKRALDVQVFAGVGVNYSFKFDDKVERWTRYGYPVEKGDHVNFAFRGGLQLLYKVSNSADIALQGAYNMVGDNYNGVKHSTSFAFDPYVEVTAGVRLHLPDHYGDYRYWKVRRWEAASLRGSETKVAHLLDDEKLKEYQSREASERVAFGQLMQTRIAFYIDRTFVNDYQMENLRIVADFLRRHPEVHLVVKGYCGASTRSESPDMHLAERRVASVKKVLTKYYGVDASRFETWFDETAVPPFPMKGEWIDGVVFLMTEQ